MNERKTELNAIKRMINLYIDRCIPVIEKCCEKHLPKAIMYVYFM